MLVGRTWAPAIGSPCGPVIRPEKDAPAGGLIAIPVTSGPPLTTCTKVIIPATLPYLFTGYRLSLGIAWLVIVASEMLTGTPGVGGFLWQEYNSLIYAHILLAIITIGVTGFALDRLMGMAETRLRVT